MLPFDPGRFRMYWTANSLGISTEARAAVPFCGFCAKCDQCGITLQQTLTVLEMMDGVGHKAKSTERQCETGMAKDT